MPDITDEQIDAYLKAQAACVQKIDDQWGRGGKAPSYMYPVRTACRAGLEAAFAIRPSASAAPGQWQPIETAPKDGTEVLLYGDGRMTFGAWAAPSKTPTIRYQDGFAPEEEWQDFDPHWASWDGGFTEVHPPTQWMPLPAAPGSSPPPPTEEPGDVEQLCEWTYDGDYTGAWSTACGQMHAFTDGGPAENSHRFCCYCGGRLGITDAAAALPEHESLETSEADAVEPHQCAHSCRHALDGHGLAPQCLVGCRRAEKEWRKG